MPSRRYHGLVHNFTWSEVAWISLDGNLEYVSYNVRGRLDRSTFNIKGWKDGLTFVGGMIFRQFGYRTALAAYFQSEKEHYLLNMGIPNFAAELKALPGYVDLASSNRPLMDSFGRPGMKKGFWQEAKAWTVTLPNLTYRSAEMEDGVVLVSTFEYTHPTRGSDQILSKRKFKLPREIMQSSDWKIVDIHPTLGNLLILRASGDVWCVVEIPSDRSRSLSKIMYGRGPRNPFIWTRLGYRLGLWEETPFFEGWTGEILFPSMG